MRNIFDQYKHPENRLTHSLIVSLNQDRKLLKDFLISFGPEKVPPVQTLRIIGQGLPGSTETNDEEQAEKRGLPDAVIFDDNGWALVLESKISSDLSKDQLQRHYQTIRRCGVDDIYGLTITLDQSPFLFKGWKMATWKDIYSWANRSQSSWAKHMVHYFNVAENNMVQNEYLTAGTITEFSGINLEPYTYHEGKRVLRLLTDKIRNNAKFMKEMNLDPESRRPAITDDGSRVWDMISFRNDLPKGGSFTGYPHCTFNLSNRDKWAEAMITFPNAMERSLFKRLKNSSYESFAQRLETVLAATKNNLRGISGYKPVARIVQRHYKTQRSPAVIDGEMTVDLRACFGGKDAEIGRPIVAQEQWLYAIHALLSDKRSNLQFQIGVQLPYKTCPELKTKNADRIFMASYRSLGPFIKHIIEG
jgi:hypothetical protein